MTICGLCGKPVSEGKNDPTEIVLCKTCGDMLKGNFVFVVRCKDCKHRDDANSPYWELWCKRNDRSVDGDWFCADGEKRT